MIVIPRRQRVIVGLSGGVDSAVSAHLLCEQGFDVQGLFMKNWEDDDSETLCTAAEDLDDAKQVCEVLGIPLHQANFARQYREEVFEHCLGEYRAGRTPNPDVLCNQRIKFRAFVDHALRLGADLVATGHYADVANDDGRRRLLRAADATKDQSYFLYTLGQEQLALALFPLARLRKVRVREIAEELGFDNCTKKDSTGICFIGERDFRGFLGRYIESNPGDIVSPQGTTVGAHQGLAFYTLGQRRGLELGGQAGHSTEPWYVVDKDTAANRLVVAQGHDHPLLMSDALDAGQLCWVSGERPKTPILCTAKIRYRQLDQPCVVEAVTGTTVRVRFDEPQRAVAPGQSVVFYDGDVCLGGGIIECRYQALQEEPMRGSA